MNAPERISSGWCAFIFALFDYTLFMLFAVDAVRTYEITCAAKAAVWRGRTVEAVFSNIFQQLCALFLSVPNGISNMCRIFFERDVEDDESDEMIAIKTKVHWYCHAVDVESIDTLPVE